MTYRTTLLTFAVALLSARIAYPDDCWQDGGFYECTDDYGSASHTPCDPEQPCSGDDITIYEDSGNHLYKVSQDGYYVDFAYDIVCKREQRCRIYMDGEGEYYCGPDDVFSRIKGRFGGDLNWHVPCGEEE